MIFAEARRRHQERPAFQQRLAEQQAPAAGKEPSLWRLKLAPEIFREVLQDVAAAQRTCSVVDAGLRSMQDACEERKKGNMESIQEHSKPSKESSHERGSFQMKVQRHMPRLSALGFFNQNLLDARSNEEWTRLMFIADE
jgi:hypothetical protein